MKTLGYISAILLFLLAVLLFIATIALPIFSIVWGILIVCNDVSNPWGWIWIFVFSGILSAISGILGMICSFASVSIYELIN